MPPETIAATNQTTKPQLPSFVSLLQESISFAWSRLDLAGWYFLMSLLGFFGFLLVGIVVGGLGFALLGSPAVAVTLFAAAALVVVLGFIYIMTLSVGGIMYAALAETPETTFWMGWRYMRQEFWAYMWVASLGILLMIGSFTLLMIPAIVVATYVYFHFAVFLAERTRGLQTFLRSTELVHGYWWAVFGRVLDFGLVMLLVGVVMQGALFAAITFSRDPAQLLALQGSIQLLSSLLNIFLAVVAFSFLARLYKALLVIKGPATAPATIGKRWYQVFVVIGSALLVLVTLGSFLLFSYL